jgi:hypothetical protein
VNTSIAVKKKNALSHVTNEREYVDSYFDGSTGMNIGMQQSPNSHLAKAMIVVGGGAPLTEELPSFDKSAKFI